MLKGNLPLRQQPRCVEAGCRRLVMSPRRHVHALLGPNELVRVLGNEGSCPIVESHLVLVRLTILDDIKRDDCSCLGNAIAHVAEDTGALAKASACALPLGLRVALRLCPQLTLRDARIAREAGVPLGVHRSP